MTPDILVTFEDGTTELRASNSFVHYVAAWRLRGCGIMRDDKVAAARDRYFKLAEKRGRHEVTVWRITGQDPTTKALTGEWQSCRVESIDEQLARLTQERDFAIERHDDLVMAMREAETAEQFNAVEGGLFSRGPIARLFSTAVLGALQKAPNFYLFRVTVGHEVAAIVTIQRPTGKLPEDRYHEEKTRADALAKQLADLREWAEMRRSAHAGRAAAPADGHAWTVETVREGVFAEVVARIDGEGR